MFGSVRGAVCTPTRPGRVTADDDPQPTDLVDAAPLPFRSFAALHTVPVGAEAAVLGLVVGATGPESVLTRRGRTTLRATLSVRLTHADTDRLLDPLPPTARRPTLDALHS